MLTTRIIPCLDIKHGQVVKGIRFANLVNLGDPVEHAIEYYNQGADELALLDVAATIEQRDNQREIVSRIRRRISIPILVGGGVKNLDDAKKLFDAGADRVAINSAAVINPDLLARIAYEFGSQSTVLALDVTRSNIYKWEVIIHSGSKRVAIDALRWAVEAVNTGAGEIMLTSFDNDGSGQGYDTQLIQAVSQVTNVPIIASGGASNPNDFIDAINAGADAVLAASVFHYGKYTVKDIKTILAHKGKDVRI